MKVRFVLVETQSPGNIGAAARAIKVMGFSELWLVAPRCFPDDEATRFAREAHDVLGRTRVVASLDEALLGCSLTFATSARRRSADWPTLRADAAASLCAGHPGTAAFVFGPEPGGLPSEAVYATQYRSYIPTGAQSSSLNLAQAVQVYAYALRQALDTDADAAAETSAGEGPDAPASFEALQGFYAQLRDSLVALDFPKRDPDHLMLRFMRVFNRSELSSAEVNLLHGLFARIEERNTDD